MVEEKDSAQGGNSDKKNCSLATVVMGEKNLHYLKVNSF
jgi:hypothetical protein